MAITDFFHCENVADSIVDSIRFKTMLEKIKLPSSDFKPPHRHLIGGDLLDINFASCYHSNKKVISKEAMTFGYSWMGDGATIARVPLINILNLSGNVPPTVISIHDCTAHMVAGGKKDAPYIAGLFQKKVDEFDPSKMFTDIFFFDGASNVQKAGEILCVKNPRAYCFHGGGTCCVSLLL